MLSAEAATEPKTVRHNKPVLSAERLSPDRITIAVRDPFFIFEFHNFFDPETYRQLDSRFPKKAIFPATWVDRGGKSYMNSKMPEFAAFTRKEPAWMELYERFRDPSVLERFYALAHSVPSERPASERKPWRLVERENKSTGLFRKPIAKFQRFKENLAGHTPARLSFEFSYLEAGCYLPPHTDVPGKLISLMLYFPDEGVKYPSAGTEFYRGKNNTPAAAGWTTGMMDDESSERFFEQHETFYTSDFGPNKLVGFVKTATSWHGLKRLDIPPNATRRSLNVNYFLA